MDKLRVMETFVRIVEAGSLTRAADGLQTSSPTSGRSAAARSSA
jgi:DNA-binding transcriptional LysR family regulator